MATKLNNEIKYNVKYERETTETNKNAYNSRVRTKTILTYVRHLNITYKDIIHIAEDSLSIVSTYFSGKPLFCVF